MVVIKKQCEVHLSQEEIDCLEKAADILNEIWSVMPAEGYIGEKKVMYTEDVGEMSDNLQDLVTIGENIVIED